MSETISPVNLLHNLTLGQFRDHTKHLPDSAAIMVRTSDNDGAVCDNGTSWSRGAESVSVTVYADGSVDITVSDIEPGDD